MINPSRYRFLIIGKIRKGWIKEGLNLYLKRLPGLEITELRDSNPQREAKAILTEIRRDELLVALSEEGENLDSISFSNRLQVLGSQRLAFAIGGADGFAPEIKDSAHWLLSLSSLTFPHEISSLLLAEQIYRSNSILQRSPYHRE